jgi:acetoacetyl-CoA synthetase
MAEKLWQPSAAAIKQTNMYRFMQFANKRHKLQCSQYSDLYDWSVSSIDDFWAAVWDFVEIIHSKPYTRIVDDTTNMPGAKWFEGARLNFAENLLRFRDDQTALVFKGEALPAKRITYAELYDEVARTAAAMKAHGVSAGDRVVGFMPNILIAFFAVQVGDIPISYLRFEYP